MRGHSPYKGHSFGLNYGLMYEKVPFLLKLNEERGIRVKCMKRIDGNKDKFNWAANDEFYYEQEEILCQMTPPFPTNSRMTLAFSERIILDCIINTLLSHILMSNLDSIVLYSIRVSHSIVTGTGRNPPTPTQNFQKTIGLLFLKQ